MDRINGMLGLAMAAKKLALGSKALESIQNKEAHLVLISDDASENTNKKYKDKSSYYQIKCYMISDETMNSSIGRSNVKTISVNDIGFAKKMIEILESEGD